MAHLFANSFIMKKIKKSIKDLKNVKNLSTTEAKAVKGGFIIVEDLVDG
jgi:hypothetical protein